MASNIPSGPLSGNTHVTPGTAKPTPGPTTSSSTTSGEKTGDGIKGIFAGIHGMGEKARGEFNAGVDKTFDEDSSKGVKTAASGDKEMMTGQFSRDTKEREGAMQTRHEQANTDLNRE